MTMLLLFGVVLGLGYSAYQVWFRPDEFSKRLQDLYVESARTPRALAGSKLTLWLYRIGITTMFLLTMWLFLGGVYFWVLDRLG